ncbi:TDA2 Topoisomerase I damage affected protein 2 [Candida maltosa Xu316]
MVGVEIINKSDSVEAPFTQEFIVKLIKENVELDSKHLIDKIGEALKEKSSKHKFIVQATTFTKDNDSFDLKVQSDFIALWDSKKDGCITLEIEKTKVVTIYWISS